MGVLSGTHSFSKLEEDVTGRDCGCQSGSIRDSNAECISNIEATIGNGDLFQR